MADSSALERALGIAPRATAATMFLSGLADRTARWRLNRSGVTSNYFQTPEGRIHYYDFEGQGALPPMVLVHGASSAASDYSTVIRRLRRHTRRLIAPDSPAHGFSDRPEMLTPATLERAMFPLLDALVDEPVILIGNSLGGAMALRYTLARPEKILGLFLLSPAGAAMPDAARAALFRRLECRTVDEGYDFIQRAYHRQPLFRAVMAREVRRRFQTKPMRQFFGAIGPEDELSPEQLAKLRPPTKLVWGQADRLLPRSFLRYYVRHMPAHVEIEQPPHFGHVPYLEYPWEVADMILDFARKVVAQT